MAGTIEHNLTQSRQWLSYGANWIAAKTSTAVLNGGHILTREYGGVFAVLAGISQSAAALLTMGVVSGTSAALAQIHYRHEINNLIDNYRDELADKLKKSPRAITEKDLECLAKGSSRHGLQPNNVIAGQLRKIRAQRLLDVGLSMAASLATYGIMAAAIVTHGPVALPILLAEGAVGFAIYSAIKMPLHALGNKLFGLNYETTHERIENLKLLQEDDKVITREQVLEVLASVNPKLSHNEAMLAQATQMTDALNSHRLKAADLVTILGEQAPPAPPLRQPRPAVEYDNPAPKQSHAERVLAGRQAARQQPSQTIH